MRKDFLYNHADLVACLLYEGVESNSYVPVLGMVVDRIYESVLNCNMYKIEWADGKIEWYAGSQVEKYAACYRTQVDLMYNKSKENT